MSASGSAAITAAVKTPLTRLAAATSWANLARNPASSANSILIVLTATSRPAVDRPRNTWPMAPAPSRPSNPYGPICSGSHRRSGCIVGCCTTMIVPPRALAASTYDADSRGPAPGFGRSGTSPGRGLAGAVGGSGGLGEPGLTDGRLEQFHRVARRVLDQDLLAAYAGDDLVAEGRAAGPQVLHGGRQVGHLDRKPVPAARLRHPAIGHRLAATRRVPGHAQVQVLEILRRPPSP